MNERRKEDDELINGVGRVRAVGEGEERRGEVG